MSEEVQTEFERGLAEGIRRREALANEVLATVGWWEEQCRIQAARIEELEARGAAQAVPGSREATLRMVAVLFAKSVHETYTREEVVSVVEDWILPNDFANEIASSIDRAQERGIDLDIAVCVAIGVAADYARAEYGDEYLNAMAHVIMQRAGKPLPRSGDPMPSTSNDCDAAQTPES
jgi:hypothetical protein